MKASVALWVGVISAFTLAALRVSAAEPPAMLRGVPRDQVETVVDGARIQAAVSQGAASAIWETLEFAERVECIDCIPVVEPLLYDRNPRTREIAAWWLRRRLLGVFGPNETYARVVAVLASDGSAERRAYAADALGEMLTGAGEAPLVAALERDPDPTVRASAARAMGRLNSDGRGALARALADADVRVRAATLAAVGRVNVFADVPAVARLLGDSDASVRRRAIGLLDSLRARDAGAGVMVLAKNDPDDQVRLAACHALGTFGDPAARETLLTISETDRNGFVRDHARIALRRLP